MEQNVKKSLGVGIFLIVAIGIFFRTIAYFSNPSFWFDESALAYNILSLKYQELFGILHLQQVAPPVFLVLSKWVGSVFGVSEMALRFIPYLFGILVFIPFYLLLKEIFNKRSTINFAMLLLAINPILIRYSNEFKPYILDVFFACLIFYLFLKIDLKTFSVKKLLSYGFVMGFAVWLSFASVIVASVGLLTLLISQKVWKKWAILVLPIVLNYALLVVYYLKISSFYKTFMNVFFANEFRSFAIPIKYFFNNDFSFSIFVTALTLIIGILYFLMEKKKFEIAFMIWCFVVTVLLSNLHIYPAYERFILFLLPYTIVLIAMVFHVLSERKNIQSKLVLVIILCALVPLSIAHKNSKARELTEYFMKKVKPNQIVVVDNLALPDFLYYTYGKKFNNKIYTEYIKKNERLLYMVGSQYKFPKKHDECWFYATRTGGFNKILKKENDIEKIEGFTLLDKKIYNNGAVLHIKK